jgi:surface polysaccharide O-acyltransferase-like enzyme
MASEKKQRTVYLDLLRVLAMVGVVGIHVSAKHFADVPLSSSAWHAMNLWDGLVRWSVPMFAMVSGAVFLDPERRITAQAIYKKYLPRIILAFALWSALYAAIDCHGSLRVFVTQLLRGHYHLWFLYMLAGVYLVVPILRRVTREPRLTWYFLVLSAVFTFGVPDLVLLSQAADRAWALGLAPIVTEVQQYMMFFLTLGFVPYFVLGYALHARTLTRRETLILCALGVLGFVLSPLLNARYSAVTGSAQVEFFAYNKFCVLFQTAGVFAAAKACAARLHQGVQQWVIRLAACSFGVYLAHPLLLDHLVPSGILTCGAWAYLTIPAVILLVALGALAVSVLLRRLPWLGKRIV